MAFEAHAEMQRIDETGIAPHPTNADGRVLKFDPLQHSFKEALTAIVFSGVYIEAILHLTMVSQLGIKQAKSMDRANYENKLRALGISNERLFEHCKQFAEVRRSIVHEKAHIDTYQRRLAQTEASSAIRLVKKINHYLGLSNPTVTSAIRKNGLTGWSSGRQPASRVGALRTSYSGAAYRGR